MKSDLQQVVDDDVKRVEVAIDQDEIDLLQLERVFPEMREDGSESIGVIAWVIFVPIIFILVILVIFYSGHP